MDFYGDLSKPKFDNSSNFEEASKNNLIPNLIKIKVIGVGGAGCSAINRMIEDGVTNVEFIAVNTDLQALANSLAKKKLQIGSRLTKGLGAGAKPEIGEKAAQEDIEEIRNILQDSNMVFITAGMGGGTGTGAAPVIAKLAKEMGILTVAIVSVPFEFEGKKRFEIAQQGLKKLKENVDTILIISNTRVYSVVERKTNIIQAFRKIDEILMNAVQGITSIIYDIGDINVDFADICTVLSNKGEAIMGVGVGSGDNRAVEAARMALENPLVENSSFKNAGSVLVNIIGGYDFSITELQEASNIIREYCRDDAMIILGLKIDQNIKDKVKIIIIAADFNDLNSIEKEENISQILPEEIIEQRKVVNLAEIQKSKGITLTINNKNKNYSISSNDFLTPPILRNRTNAN